MAVADTIQRSEALDTGRSFCLQAPAGSGKTELLTQRILCLLARSEMPENILAITFTRKASAEMRERLLSILNRSRPADAPVDTALPEHEQLSLRLGKAVLLRDREMDWQLLANPSRLHITTIDSFNASLASQLPLLSGFGAKPDISDKADVLYDEAVIELLRQLEGGSTISNDLAFILEHLDNNILKIQGLLCTLLAKREQWLEHILRFQHADDDTKIRDTLEQTLTTVIEETLGRAHHLFAALLPDLMADLKFARKQLQELDPKHELASADMAFLENILVPGNKAEHLAVWRALAGLLLTQAGTLRKNVDKRSGFPAESSDTEKKKIFKTRKDDFKKRLEAIRLIPDAELTLVHIISLPDTVFKDSQWQVLSALTRVLYRLVGELNLVFQKHNQCDYTQVSSAALQALGDEDNPTAHALRLDYQIRHILVDEFQDTSYIQKHLLERLTRGWEPEDGRTLFIVGDGMQSCYGFRNANVGLFLDARDHGIGTVRLESRQLGVNFRSETAVVDWVNLIFSKAFPQHDDIGRGAVRYTPAIGLHCRFAAAGVETVLLQYEKDAAADRLHMARAEAEKVAAIIARIQADEPGTSIAILVKNRSHIRAILPALRQRNIIWNATEIDPLDSYMEIQDIFSLCRALLNPADTTAWLALLRSPWMGLGMADILTLTHSAKTQGLNLWQALQQYGDCMGLSGKGRRILERCLPVLVEAREQRQRLVLRDWLQHTWLSLGGSACLGNEIDTSHLEAFFALLETESHAADIADVHRIQSALSRLYVNSKLNPLARLQIMTIHKAKGLEFDHVILPRLNSGGRNDDAALLQWTNYVSQDSEARLLLSIPERKGQEQDRLHRFLREESRERRAMEDTRVLYIGVTRAIRKAWLIASISADAKGQVKAESGSLLSRIWEALLPLEDNVTVIPGPAGPAVSPPAGNEVTPPLITQSLPADWQHPAPLPLPWTESAICEAETAAKHPIGFTAAMNQAERLRGDIMHYCLKLAAEGKLELAQKQRLQSLVPHWRRQFAACSDNPDEMAEIILHQLASLEASEEGRWALDCGHESAACELVISDHRGSWRREYVVDRTFIDKGIRWIIDYKSAAVPGNQSQEGFIRERVEIYRPQLEHYANLFRAMEDRPVKTALLFTALPRLEVLF